MGKRLRIPCLAWTLSWAVVPFVVRGISSGSAKGCPARTRRRGARRGCGGSQVLLVVDGRAVDHEHWGLSMGGRPHGKVFTLPGD